MVVYETMPDPKRGSCEPISNPLYATDNNTYETPKEGVSVGADYYSAPADVNARSGFAMNPGYNSAAAEGEYDAAEGAPAMYDLAAGAASGAPAAEEGLYDVAESEPASAPVAVDEELYEMADSGPAVYDMAGGADAPAVYDMAGGAGEAVAASEGVYDLAQSENAEVYDNMTEGNQFGFPADEEAVYDMGNNNDDGYLKVDPFGPKDAVKDKNAYFNAMNKDSDHIYTLAKPLRAPNARD
jgi:hypothetical protein